LSLTKGLPFVTTVKVSVITKVRATVKVRVITTVCATASATVSTTLFSNW